MSEKNYPWIVWHYMVPVHHGQWCHSAHFWRWALSPLLFSQFFLTGFLFSLFHCRKCSLLGNTDSNLRNLSAEMKCLISFVLYSMSCFLSCAKLCWHGISSFFFFSSCEWFSTATYFCNSLQAAFVTTVLKKFILAENVILLFIYFPDHLWIHWVVQVLS